MIKIDYRDARPIYEQVVDGIEGLALRGALPADTQLPSVRQLAMELSINPNTIQRAYGELERRGVIYAAKGPETRPVCGRRAQLCGEGPLPGGGALCLLLPRYLRNRLNELGEQITALAGQARSLGVTEEQLRGWVARKGESRT